MATVTGAAATAAAAAAAKAAKLAAAAMNSKNDSTSLSSRKRKASTMEEEEEEDAKPATPSSSTRLSNAEKKRMLAEGREKAQKARQERLAAKAAKAAGKTTASSSTPLKTSTTAPATATVPVLSTPSPPPTRSSKRVRREKPEEVPTTPATTRSTGKKQSKAEAIQEARRKAREWSAARSEKKRQRKLQQQRRRLAKDDEEEDGQDEEEVMHDAVDEPEADGEGEEEVEDEELEDADEEDTKPAPSAAVSAPTPAAAVSAAASPAAAAASTATTPPVTKAATAAAAAPPVVSPAPPAPASSLAFDLVPPKPAAPPPAPLFTFAPPTTPTNPLPTAASNTTTTATAEPPRATSIQDLWSSQKRKAALSLSAKPPVVAPPPDPPTEVDPLAPPEGLQRQTSGRSDAPLQVPSRPTPTFLLSEALAEAKESEAKTPTIAPPTPKEDEEELEDDDDKPAGGEEVNEEEEYRRRFHDAASSEAAMDEVYRLAQVNFRRESSAAALADNAAALFRAATQDTNRVHFDLPSGSETEWCEAEEEDEVEMMEEEEEEYRRPLRLRLWDVMLDLLTAASFLLSFSLTVYIFYVAIELTAPVWAPSNHSAGDAIVKEEVVVPPPAPEPPKSAIAKPPPCFEDYPTLMLKRDAEGDFVGYEEELKKVFGQDVPSVPPQELVEAGFEGCVGPRQECPAFGKCHAGYLMACETDHLQVNATTLDHCVLSELGHVAATLTTLALTDLAVERECSLSCWLGIAEYSVPTDRVVLVQDDDQKKKKIGFEYQVFYTEDVAKVVDSENVTADHVDILSFYLQEEGVVSRHVENDVSMLGLSPLYLATQFHLPVGCWLGKVTLALAVELCNAVLWGAQVVSKLIWHAGVAYPLPTFCMVLLWMVVVWMHWRRKARRELRALVALVREMAYERLRECDVGEGCAVLHLRDDLAHERHPTSVRHRLEFSTRVWPQVVGEVRLDNRVRKSKVELEERVMDVWIWMAPRRRRRMSRGEE